MKRILLVALMVLPATFAQESKVTTTKIKNPDGSVTTKMTEKVQNPDGSITTKITQDTPQPDGSTKIEANYTTAKPTPEMLRFKQIAENVASALDVITYPCSTEEIVFGDYTVCAESYGESLVQYGVENLMRSGNGMKVTYASPWARADNHINRTYRVKFAQQPNNVYDFTFSVFEEEVYIDVGFPE